MNIRRTIVLGGVLAALYVSTLAAQKAPKATTHSTKGTIASINGDTLVINQTVRGKAQQLTLTLNSQTQRSGELAAGNPVTVQYHQDKNDKIATAVRESSANAGTRPAKISTKPTRAKS